MTKTREDGDAACNPPAKRWPPPAYYMYASDFMGNEHYRLATPVERSLLWMVMNYCWVNDSIPANPAAMAQVLGISEPDVEHGLGPLFQAFVKPLPGNPQRLHVPDHGREKHRLRNARAILSASGRKGGRATQAGIKRASEASSLA